MFFSKTEDRSMYPVAIRVNHKFLGFTYKTVSYVLTMAGKGEYEWISEDGRIYGY